MRLIIFVTDSGLERLHDLVFLNKGHHFLLHSLYHTTALNKLISTEFILKGIFYAAGSNADFFLARIFLYSNGKYGPEKFTHLDTFHAVLFINFEMKSFVLSYQKYFLYFLEL